MCGDPYLARVVKSDVINALSHESIGVCRKGTLGCWSTGAELIELVQEL